MNTIRTEIGDPVRGAVPHSYDHDCTPCGGICAHQVDRGAELDWHQTAVNAGHQIPPFRIVDNQVPR